MKKVLHFIRVFIGVLCAIYAVTCVVLIFTMQEARWAFVFLAVVFGLFAFLSLRRKKEKPLVLEPLVPEPVEVEQSVDAYIKMDGGYSRVDGKQISDKEVPYLIERGWQDLLECPAGAPPDATPDELVFFTALEKELVSAGKSPYFRATRMSDHVLSVSSSKAYLGKIRLQGRKTWMQYPTYGGNFDVIEYGTLEAYIGLIPKWVKIA